jgi:hypothetical protein
MLPPAVDEVRIYRLPVGSDEVDLRLVRHGSDVALTILRARGQVEVVLVK